jgi:hypothetical protein
LRPRLGGDGRSDVAQAARRGFPRLAQSPALSRELTRNDVRDLVAARIDDQELIVVQHRILVEPQRRYLAGSADRNRIGGQLLRHDGADPGGAFAFVAYWLMSSWTMLRSESLSDSVSFAVGCDAVAAEPLAPLLGMGMLSSAATTAAGLPNTSVRRTSGQRLKRFMESSVVESSVARWDPLSLALRWETLPRSQRFACPLATHATGRHGAWSTQSVASRRAVCSPSRCRKHCLISLIFV